MDKKEARKILGVSRETSKHDIERKYAIILKKHKMEKDHVEDETYEYAAASQDAGIGQNPGTTPDAAEKQQEYSFEQITQAYNVLMDYEVAIKEEPPSKAAPLLKKAGIDEKKARNFYYYYKFHILGAIVAIIAIVLTVRGCVTRVEPDFTTAFIGNIIYTETEKLGEAIKANIPDIKEPGFDGAFLTEGGMGEQEYAMTMKATVLLAAGDVDIFITDKKYFERYAEQGAFASLDEIAGQLGVDMEKNKDYIVKIDNNSDDDTGGNTGGSSGGAAEGAEEAEEEHLYGIDVSDSTVLKDSGIIGKEMIASIYIRCEQTDKAVKLLQLLMK